MNIVKPAALVLIGLTSGSYAQESIDIDNFVKDLNNAIKSSTQGVSVKNMNISPVVASQAWANAITSRPQDFAVIAVDAEDNPVDIFGASTPFVKAADSITVPGYTLPEGGRYKTVGASGWADAVTVLASHKAAKQVPSSSIVRAVSTITSATDYIAQELCPKKSRPTKLVLNLNAGFELVFNASTGSEVVWDLEIVCKRIK